MSENSRPTNPQRRTAPSAQRPQAAGARSQYAQRPAGVRPAGARPAGSRPQGSRPQGSRPPQRRRRKKKNNSGIVALLLLAVVLVIALVVIIPRLGRNNQPEQPVVAQQTAETTEAAVTQSPSIATAIATPGPAIKAQTLDPANLSINTALDGTWRSILLLGTDARLWDDMKHTDTMIVVCYNLQNGSVRLISVMRDMFVDIPEKGNVRLNTVSSYGGIQRLAQLLNEKLGLNIQEYMMVDFAGFRNAVDILGGIEIDITETEMNYINYSLTEQVNLLVEKRYRQRVMEECTLTTYGPATHLNGIQALAYARIRKSDNDYKRTERQRTVVLAAVNKAMQSMTVPQMTQIAGTMLQYVETNIPLTGLIQLAAKVMSSGVGDIQQTRLPINDSFKGETRKNVWGMYDVDWAPNQREVQSLLYGY